MVKQKREKKLIKTEKEEGERKKKREREQLDLLLGTEEREVPPV